MSKQRKHDDLAAALSAMSSGEVTDDHHGDEVHDDTAATDAAHPAPVAPPPVSRTPSPPAPPSPRSIPTPTHAAAESKPAPRVRPTAPSTRPAAPVAPVQAPASDSPFDHQAPDDDDAVIVPAPDQSVFEPKRKAAPAPRKPRVAVYQTMEFRQTVIPVMLTSGTICIVLAILRMLASEESIFAVIPSSVSAILIVAGLVLLACAAINMMHVKKLLDEKAAK